MIKNIKPTAPEPEYGPRDIPGRNVEYFVELLWQGNIDKTFNYAHGLIEQGVHYSALTLAAAQSYFPFAYGLKEQTERAKKIAERFSEEPFHWKDSFIRNGFYRPIPVNEVNPVEKLGVASSPSEPVKVAVTIAERFEKFIQSQHIKDGEKK
ncbi:MAG: hypothetical protein WCK29_04470 [archaeon]